MCGFDIQYLENQGFVCLLGKRDLIIIGKVGLQVGFNNIFVIFCYLFLEEVDCCIVD